MLKITQPTLLLNRKICEGNIRKMLSKAEDHKVQLIPHFKTHQSAAVGEWFKEAGVTAITVTSVKMAKYFARHGWKDITIAFPVNVLEIQELNSLSARIDLRIFINSEETADILKSELNNEVRFFIEIDSGDGRSGIAAGDLEKIERILHTAQGGNLKFDGFYSHPGHTYHATSKEEIKAISAEVLKKLQALKGHFKGGFPDIKIAFGDTPSCSIVQNFEGIDSIHPGNFVYYDLVQEKLGANTVEEIAICLAVPVVAVHPERQEVIVHSGWTHHGKDELADANGEVHYGLVVQLEENGWSAPIPDAKVVKLSQEHGVLRLPAALIQKINVGEVLGVLPVHACATALMMGEVYTLKGQRLEMMRR